MKKYFVTLVLALAFNANANANANANLAYCLEQAYPESITVKADNILFKSGITMPIGVPSRVSFLEILAHPSIADQLFQRYPLGFVSPKQYSDPGRIRNNDFFKAMYGASESSIRSNLVSVYWKPANKMVLFNRVNGASIQLQKVGEEISKYPDLAKYVNNTLGSFYFRKIAGTNRLSAHSFGIAIDFQLPQHLHKYWRWDGCTVESEPCSYPSQLLDDVKLQKIVKIFEKYGFIWGGKWSSYDSVHFEYRPELLISACR